MPAIYHEGGWIGNATDPEVLVKDTVGWTGKNRAYSQTNNAVIAHIESGITYDVSWTGSATVTLKKNSASGATITSGSTSPLSFTADADYELYFGSSATVTNIMVKDSRITDPTYEPYHESVQNQLNAQGVLGAKNLLPNTGTSQTINGITFTVNDDGSVTANGTATAQAIFWVTGSNNNRYTFDKDVIISGCPSGGSGSTYALGGNNVGIVTDEAMITAGNAISVACVIYSGVTVSNLTFKPMLRLASDPDDTYQPYTMTNRELTEKKINIADLKTVVSASSDFADFKTRIASL